jgi:hypothetical protein
MSSFSHPADIIPIMPHHDDIKRFVRETLGCGCPEEVFRFIDCKNNVSVAVDATADRVITIGNRLLIYVLEATAVGAVRSRLAELVTAGKKERDSKGFNRFRLVVVLDDETEQNKVAKVFEALPDKDEKVHLHMIRREKNLFSSKS